MVDDYAGYKAMFTDGPVELACLAHIRRKFFDVHAAGGSPIAHEALQRLPRCTQSSSKAPNWTRPSVWRCASNSRSRR